MMLRGANLIKSLSASCRRRRIAFFEELLRQLEPPIRIIDVGGTQSFWEVAEFWRRPGVEIVLLNTEAVRPRHGIFRSVVGDACDLSQFRDHEFDVAFSNSVIEHVGGLQEQERMAREMMRVGKRVFLQTPSRFFPIEPHFLFPGFQFLPTAVRVWLVSRLDLGHWGSCRWDPQFLVDSIRLMGKRELRQLFPDCDIVVERFACLPKSYIVVSKSFRDG